MPEEGFVIPTDGQVAELVSYLESQARFHRWQCDHAKHFADRSIYLKKANLCEGWAMGLPAVVEAAREGRK